MRELIDVVDENDQVLGQEYKDVCHAKGILHRGVTILVFKDTSCQQILIQKRSMQKISRPGHLNFVGGHITAGESYQRGAMREFQEEMFYRHALPDAIQLQELFTFKKEADGDSELHRVYKTIWPQSFFLNIKESSTCYFLTLPELLEETHAFPSKFTETCRVTLEEYQKRYLQKNIS